MNTRWKIKRGMFGWSLWYDEELVGGAHNPMELIRYTLEVKEMVVS